MIDTVTMFSVDSYVPCDMHTALLKLYCHTVRNKLLTNKDLCTVHDPVMIMSESGHSNMHSNKHSERESSLDLCVNWHTVSNMDKCAENLRLVVSKLVDFMRRSRT